MKKKIANWEIIDHGLCDSQSFIGGGVTDDFDFSYTGYGYSAQEAFNQALNNLKEEYQTSSDLEQALSEQSSFNKVLELLSQDLPELKYKVFHKSKDLGTAYFEEEFTSLDEAQLILEHKVRKYQQMGAEVVKRGEDSFELTEPQDSLEIPAWAGVIQVLSNEEQLDFIKSERNQMNTMFYYVSILIKEAK